MPIVAILADLGDAPALEDRLSVPPDRGFLPGRMLSSTGGSVTITATSSCAGRGATCWRVGRPTTASRWPAGWASSATRAAAGWHGTPPGGFRPCRRPTSPPANRSRARRQGLARWAQALPRPVGCAADAALRQGRRRTHGVEGKDKPLSTLVRTRFTTKRTGARPTPTKTPCGPPDLPGPRSRPPPAGHPACQAASPPGVQPRRTPVRLMDRPPMAPHRSGRPAPRPRATRLRGVRRLRRRGAQDRRPLLPGTARSAGGDVAALPRYVRRGVPRKSPSPAPRDP
jgi:hypothetical protein